MELTSRAQCSGVLDVIARDAMTGLPVARRRVKNKITNNGLRFIIDRLVGGTEFNLSLFNLGIGSTPVAATDTQMEASVFQGQITTRTRRDPNQLVIRHVLDSNEANGFTISEASALSGNGTLFSHAVFPGIVKTLQVVIHSIWTYTFRRVGADLSIPDVGFGVLIDALIGPNSLYLSLFNLGTGTLAVRVEDTAMQASVFQGLVSTAIRATASTMVITKFLGTVQGNTNTISEASVLATDGRMFSHAVFAGNAKSTSRQQTFTWTYTFTAT